MASNRQLLRCPAAPARISAAGCVVLAILCFAGCTPPPAETRQEESKNSTLEKSSLRKPGEGIKIGDQAIDIAGKTFENQDVSLHELRGKVVLIDFWAVWCGPCVGLIPHEKSLYRQYKNRPFAILGVCDSHRESC